MLQFIYLFTNGIFYVLGIYLDSPVYVLWFNFGLKFSNQFNFYFLLPLSQIMVINLKQKETKIKLGPIQQNFYTGNLQV